MEGKNMKTLLKIGEEFDALLVKIHSRFLLSKWLPNIC